MIPAAASGVTSPMREQHPGADLGGGGEPGLPLRPLHAHAAEPPAVPVMRPPPKNLL